MVNYRKIEKSKHKHYPAILRYLDQQLDHENAEKLGLELYRLKEKGIIDYRIRKLQNSIFSFEIWSKKCGVRDEVENLFQKYGLFLNLEFH